MSKKRQPKEYIVTLDVELSGATMVVEAADAEEAEALAAQGPDIDTSCASLTNWRVTKVEENT